MPVIALLSTLIFSIVAVIYIIRQGVDKTTLMTSLFVSAMILMLTIKGTQLYVTIVLLISVPIIAYIVVDIARIMLKNK